VKKRVARPNKELKLTKLGASGVSQLSSGVGRTKMKRS
jgi:hypothetical protein